VRHPASNPVNLVRGLGWPTSSSDRGIELATNQGIVGLVVPSAVAEKVAEELLAGPIICLADESHRWIFLAETPAGRCPDLPIGISLKSGLSRIPLPPTEGTYWLREPVVSRVPSFMSVLRVIRIVARDAAVRWYTDASTTPEQRQMLVDQLGGKTRNR
jgi:hypothetical protein